LKQVGDIRSPQVVDMILYADVVYDENGWADAREVRPVPFDLVYMKTDKEKIRVGWWKGDNWFSLRLKPSENVLRWRRKEEHS